MALITLQNMQQYKINVEEGKFKYLYTVDSNNTVTHKFHVLNFTDVQEQVIHDSNQGSRNYLSNTEYEKGATFTTFSTPEKLKFSNMRERVRKYDLDERQDRTNSIKEYPGKLTTRNSTQVPAAAPAEEVVGGRKRRRSTKKRRPTKRRKPTKRRRPTKRRPTKRRR